MIETFAFKDDYSTLLEDKFIRLVEEKSGIVFDNVKRRELKTNISICMEELGESSFARYFNRLSASSGVGGEGNEFKKLINFITINETFFFRVEEHFDILEKTVLPELVRQKEKGEPFTAWSAGCSSGEEVYSIIITLLDYAGLKENFRLEVLGTDINEDMLYIAGKGIYSGRTLNKVPQRILGAYFEPFRERFKVKDEVKQYTRFRYLNLAGPFQREISPRPDIIFFRNVLIYFNKETTTRIIEAFYNLLNDGGYLFLGPSETLWDITDKFELMMFDRAYIYRKRSAAEIKEKRAAASREIKAGIRTPTPSPPAFSFPSSGEEKPSVPPPDAAVEGVSQAGDLFPSVKDKLRILQDEAGLMIELGDYRKAEEVLDEVMLLEKHSKPAILLKMTIFSNQAQVEKLNELVKETLTIHPIFPELHFLLGRFYESRGNVKEAVMEYRKVLFIDPDYLLARERLMRVLSDSGEVHHAQREARNILEQLAGDKYKEFEFSVDETVDKESLEKTCKQVLT
jgi:chemotaxis protein methyltransferase CheR